jgi:catechol 2,3-dioxygenase-like lactoylglutathione lyase family enzyme
MLHSLDHVVVAVRDLAGAARDTSLLLGRRPSWVGVHPGAGTANTLFRLENTYLELLAPAGEGALGGRVAAALAERGEGLLALAFGTADAEAYAARLRERGVGVDGPRSGMGRDEDSGALRRWRSVGLDPVATRGLALFAIEHEDPPDALALRPPDGDPAAAAAALDHVVVWSRDLAAAAALYGDALGLRLALDRSFEARGVRILFFRVGSATLEVVGRLDGSGAASEPDRFGGLAWRVGDVEAARARLAAADFDVSEVRAGAKPGTRVCTVRSRTRGVPTLLIGPEASLHAPGVAG